MPRRSNLSSDFETPERMSPDPEVVSCPSCGRENPASHRFCGMCGTTLPGEAQTAGDREEDSGERHEQPAVEPETLPKEYDARREPEPFAHSITNPNELSLFRSFRPKDSNGEYWEEEAHSPYRIYFAVLIALMIAGLAYMAWRTSKAGPQNAHEAPPVPTTEEKTAAPADQTPSKTTESSASKTAESASRSTASTSAPPAYSNQVKSEAANRAQPPAKSEASATEAERTQTPPDNGGVELAQARHSLAARDGAEAERWLWKSVAKHNGEATVMLADLYLKGDGVSKNCDQARVLLDSAARKGVEGAGERLRNLQAFGCP